MPLNIETKVELNNGKQIPLFGLGVYLTSEGQEIRQTLQTAFEIGYRHIDTAAFYANEEGCGAAIRESGIPREEFYITTKLWNDDHGYDQAMRAFDLSHKKIGLEYIDLYLIHWPVQEKRKETWKALEEIASSDRVGAIGVSNYMLHHLQEMEEYANVIPAVNQFELHPFNYGSRKETVEYCLSNGILPEAYSPLTRGKRFGDPVLQKIAGELGKTPAQVLIRWSLQHGFSCIPKSSNPGRLAENADVFGFEIPSTMMEELNALDSGLAVSWDPTKAV